MVQIILNTHPEFKDSVFLSLYIPHGSDNTKAEPTGLLPAEALYIPHGSDNTTCVVSLDLAVVLANFISHMVQIILESV